MANVYDAIDFVIWQEDKTQSGHVTTLKGDNGGATRYGIASRFHPELIRLGFFDEEKVGPREALLMAHPVYLSDYARPLGVPDINSQRLATAVLSFGVNAGIKPAAFILQHIAGVDCDCVVGPKTIEAVNALEPEMFFHRFSVSATAHYDKLA